MGEKEGRINLISRWIDRNQGIYRRISRVSKIVSGDTSREDGLTSPFFDSWRRFECRVRPCESPLPDGLAG